MEKERKKLAWAKQVWLKSQLEIELERANLEIASLKSKLKQAVTRVKLDKHYLSELKILNQTLLTEIQSLKLQLESLHKELEKQQLDQQNLQTQGNEIESLIIRTLDHVLDGRVRNCDTYINQEPEYRSLETGGV